MIIAGGGTGGHLFPGIAVAEEFLTRNSENVVLFVGSERGLEKKILKDSGFDLRTIDVEGIKGKGRMKTIEALLKIPRSIGQAVRIIRAFRPDIVFGVGGYASGPVLLAASFLGIKTAIAEQNAIPGITNRILGKLVDRIFLTFPETAMSFSERKTSVSGNPVRAAFLKGNGNNAAADRHHASGSPAAFTRSREHFTILVFGGSQGAHAINKAVAEALPHLEDMKSRLKIIHQTGEKDLQYVSDTYQARNFEAHVLPFIGDMSSAYRAADLVICRAGATSIAEITAMGKASVLIPFPFAVNDHQTKNAGILVKAGAAEIIAEKNLGGKELAFVIRRLYNHPELIMDMEARSASLGNHRAAADIVDACLALVAS
ncbi:MAG: undecaprenyldiphospho-muramoylpentapeptide beta-N-acetylglucosaminyltransferase [Deltaproteobacteria bacterium]|nr:undecaprenyldiphospho-muramoylpentapeptide beta-N-acetylglucosaminyltransferase [Deltaproteobacteria bacterium]